MERYSRQIKILGKIQNKLKESTVAVVGVGALGSYSAGLLARSGIGRIILIDRDYVELSNINNQNLFTEDDINFPKAVAVKEHLNKINSEIEVDALIEDLNHKNIGNILKKAEVIIDGTDNLETRFLINDFCVKNKIPWIYGAILGAEGHSFNIIPGKACLRCIVNDLPRYGSLDTCETRGIINTLPPFIASRQVTETIKILLRKKYSEKFFKVDVWKDKIELLRVKKNERCKCCVKNNFEFLNGRSSKTIRVCGVNTFQIKLTKEIENFEKIYRKLKSIGHVTFNDFILHFEINNKKLSLFKDGRVIIKGVKSEKDAKTLYSKYIG